MLMECVVCQEDCTSSVQSVWGQAERCLRSSEEAGCSKLERPHNRHAPYKIALIAGSPVCMVDCKNVTSSFGSYPLLA